MFLPTSRRIIQYFQRCCRLEIRLRTCRVGTISTQMRLRSFHHGRGGQTEHLFRRKGASYFNIDATLNKNIKINERFTAKFSATAYNVLNTYVPADPIPTMLAAQLSGNRPIKVIRAGRSIWG